MIAAWNVGHGLCPGCTTLHCVRSSEQHKHERLGAAGYFITAGDRAGGFAFLWPADTAHSCEHSGLSPSGTSTTTGGMLTSTAIAQTTPRGPGTFLLVGDAGRLTIDLPTVAILRQGTRTMQISAFRDN